MTEESEYDDTTKTTNTHPIIVSFPEIETIKEFFAPPRVEAIMACNHTRQRRTRSGDGVDTMRQPCHSTNATTARTPALSTPNNGCDL